MLRPLFVGLRRLSVIIPLYGIALAAVSRAGFPDGPVPGAPVPYLSGRVVGEDAFYSLTVASNIASGTGFTYNGGVPTTGVQVLQTLIYALLAKACLFLGGGKVALTRIVVIYNTILFWVFASIVAQIASHLTNTTTIDGRRTGRVAFAITICAFGLFHQFLYGLETSLYLVLLAALILHDLRTHHYGWTESWVFGALAALAGLARLDFGVVYAVYLGATLFYPERRPARFYLLSISIPVLAQLPWLAYVWQTTGHPLPSGATSIPPAGVLSGFVLFSAEGVAATASRCLSMINALASHLAVFLYSPDVHRHPLLFVLALVTSLALLVASARAQVTRLLSRTFSTWLVALSCILVVYPAFFWSSHFYYRYAAPISICSIPIVSVTISSLADRVGFSPRRLEVVLLLLFFFFAGATYHRDPVGNQHLISAGYIQREHARDAVGAFQSGVIGYYNENVANLDGKMDHRVVSYYRAGHLEDYLDERRIRVLIDWPSYLARLDATYLARAYGSAKPLGNGSSVLERLPASSQPSSSIPREPR